MIEFSVFKNAKPDITFAPAWTFLTDENHKPIRGEVIVDNNNLICKSSIKAFALNTVFPVNGFGQIILRTSTKPNGRIFNLNLALFEGRLEQIQEELSRCEKENAIIPTRVRTEFEALKKMPNFKTHKNASCWADAKLPEAMHLGEKVTLIRAESNLRKRLANPASKDLHFGAQPFRLSEAKRAFEEFFAPTFDMAFVPFFWCLTNQQENKRDWILTERIIRWLREKKITMVGHPLVWLHKYSTPEWIARKIRNFSELKAFLRQDIEEIIARFGKDIKIWSFTNEFSDVDANSFDLTVKELIELSKFTSSLIRAKQRNNILYLNLSEPWGAKSFIQDKPSIPPDFFVEECIRAGVDFDAIGLQFYFGPIPSFGCRDLLTISEAVDKFRKFGKEIYISEMGFPSSSEMDGFSFWRNQHPLTGGFWHKPWSEDIQAELAEKMFTIFAAKAEVTAINWFDFIDVGVNNAVFDRFIPHGGLLRRDGKPKLSFKSIQKFIQLVRKGSKL